LKLLITLPLKLAIINTTPKTFYGSPAGECRGSHGVCQGVPCGLDTN